MYKERKVVVSVLRHGYHEIVDMQIGAYCVRRSFTPVMHVVVDISLLFLSCNVILCLVVSKVVRGLAPGYTSALLHVSPTYLVADRCVLSALIAW